MHGISGQHWLRSGRELGSYERGNEGCVPSHVSAMNTGLQGPKVSIQPLPQAAMTCSSPKLGPRLGDCKCCSHKYPAASSLKTFPKVGNSLAKSHSTKVLLGQNNTNSCPTLAPVFFFNLF